MAQEQSKTTVTFPASADLSANQFKFGSLNASGQIALTAGLGAIVTGVIENRPTAAGQATEVACDGIVKVISSGAITPGAEVASTAAGLAIAAVSTNFVFGTYCGLVAAAANDIIPILVDKYYKP